MSITSISTETKAVEATPEQVAQVQAALEALVNNPEALALARLQRILAIAQTDSHMRDQLHGHVRALTDLAHSRGHEVF